MLIACHVCHPSLANDSLSGVVLAAFLARHLAAAPRRQSYRILFAPGTLGAIAWLCRNEAVVGRVTHGLVVTCVGDGGPFTYKRSRRGDAEIDRVVAHVLRHSGRAHRIRPFSPYGGDERQFCSPGFNLPVGSLMRTPYGEFEEYHSSADDLTFAGAEPLAASLDVYAAVCAVIDRNATYVNLQPKGEPQLGRRGLYGAIGGRMDDRRAELALLWVLNQSDGSQTLLDIAERAELPFDAVHHAASLLIRHGLLAEVNRTCPAR